MPVFYSDKNVSIEFRVVRAYITTLAVQQEYNIFANFSAKTVLVTKQGKDKTTEVELMSHNVLSIATSRKGETFISSRGERPVVTRGDAKVELEMIYYFSLFPGANWSDDPNEKKRYQQFLEELVIEIQEFVKEKREQVNDRENNPRPMPAMLAGLRALAPAAAPISLKKPSDSDPLSSSI